MPVMMVVVVMMMIVGMAVVMSMAGAIVGGAGADPLDMMVVALLIKTNLGLETENLIAILAHLAVHVAGTLEDLLDPVDKGVDHQGMVVQVSGLDELDPRMARRDGVGVVVDPLDQHPGEKEIREHDHPLVAELGDMLQGGLDQWEGHAGIGGLAPAETHAFP